MLKRLTLVIRENVVEHVFYPVFRPDEHAEQVLARLRSHPEPETARQGSFAAATWPSPVVVNRGVTGPGVPLVVLLHGRGSDEEEIIGLADRLPVRPPFVAC